MNTTGPRRDGATPATRLRPGDPGGHRRAASQRLEDGLEALAAGRWADAAAALGAAVRELTPADQRRPAALDALSDARWWLGELDEALAARERAYAERRQAGDDAGAARTAAWLAREYAAAAGNTVAARGWLRRAETLAADGADASVSGWVALTRALLATDPGAQARAAEEALEQSRRARDGVVEVLALGRLGLARVGMGRLAAGLACLDEAMAAATGGEADLSTLASLCCELVAAAELSGETERFSEWNRLIESLAGGHGHPPLVAFCATCCAEAFTAAGDWGGAEQQLRAALDALRRTGHRARCVAPAAKLAALLVSQGRLEEAERALAGDDSDDTLLARARLSLARGDAGSAAVLAERHRRRLGGDSLLTAPTLAFLVDAFLAAGKPDDARSAADRLAVIAADSGHRRTLGRAALARARVAVAAGDVATAASTLEEALDHLSAAAPGAVETAEARLELARLRAADAPHLAVAEAKLAIAGFETVGATRAVDAAAALLRSLGDRSRVGEKDVGVLTRREQQVLALVAQGLTNAEIAQRLFISPKTAGNHVSSVLAKLGLRSRVEAAAHAALHAGH